MIAAANAQALWFLTRGTGLVALVLLTAALVLGITEVTRWSSPRWPRFAIAALHKNISLLVIVFLGIHIVTAISDSFAPIGWLDVVVPFHSPYRPLWLGLGALAVDLLVALTITSLLRGRIGHRAWRAVHWSAYACWPLAFLHGLGTGTDSRVRWSLFVSLACLAVVVAAVAWRLWTTRSVPLAQRTGLGLGTALAVVVVLGWTFTGPTQPGWARRAGTPAALLGGAVPASARTAAGTLRPPFDASFSGRLTDALNGDRATVTIAGSLQRGANARLQIVLEGIALRGGGVQMESSSAALGTSSTPSLYQGTVTALDGTNVEATLRNTAGNALHLRARLNIDATGNSVTGLVQARSA
jgi:hypothetical protein